MNNSTAIIADIRANLTTYSDADFKVLQGRLTLNAYGADVSDALAEEVIAERKRRAFEADKAAQEAEALLEEHAAEQMIVFAGDWVKVSGMWRQVVDIDAVNDAFALLDADGEKQWWGTDAPAVFSGHSSNAEMQAKLAEFGL